jgi:hypothetical protein
VKSAEGAQKRRACKIENDGIKAKKSAEREHQAELRAIKDPARRATAKEGYRRRIAQIDADISTQRDHCAQETKQILARLDGEIAEQRSAGATARGDKTRATSAARHAAAGLRIARKVRTAKGAQKRRACKIENEAIQAKKLAERAHRAELRAIERSTERRRAPLSTAAERSSEKRGEVEGNLDPHLVPLWRKVRRSFKVPSRAEGRTSLTEAFTQWAAENPGAVQDAQEAEAAVELRKLQREERKASRNKGSGRRTRRADLPEEPF